MAPWLVAALVLSSLALVPARAATTSSTAGLNVIVRERGRIASSYDAVGSVGPVGILEVDKPPGATVRRAVLLAATTGFTRATMPGPVTLAVEGDAEPTSVLMGNGTPSGINSYNFWSDVTAVLKPALDAAPAGRIPVTVTEPSPESLVDGTLLAVIFDDPNQSADRSVTLLFGALLTGGDRFDISLERPYDPADPNAQMEFSLGISFSCQLANFCTRQYSEVDVNGRRLTSAAGGEDDGQSSNGALITVGGVGDSPASPADPDAIPANPRDDELYDLRPFLAAGDRSITVETRNPSADDNVFFAAFTGNPPVSSIATGGDKFVYVALGDSYSAGEGAGFNLRPSATYLAEGYENGSNFPPQVGPQDNTYTDRVLPPGDACHRGLLNYAKINRDRFEPGAQVVLIDRTCSGAAIEPGGKPPIVGKAGQPVDPASQLRQALERLAAAGIAPEEVDLVTVGMGGNDAKFGEIVVACMLPALAGIILDKHPDAPSDAKFISERFLTCQLLDKGLPADAGGFDGFETDRAIAALEPKELWAQNRVLGAFPNARVLQLDYVSILPTKNSPGFCGGIAKRDIEYARKKVKKINSVVRESIEVTGSLDPRLELVEVEEAFGENALCPAKVADELANGVKKAAVEQEVARLLNLDGQGDPEARRLFDRLVDEYRSWRNCIRNKANPFDGDCDLSKEFQEMQDAAFAVLVHLKNSEEVIFANVVSPPGSSDDTPEIGFDRSRGLFHPNDRGYAVLACHVLAGYQGTSPEDCAAAAPPPLRMINGQFAGATPVRVTLDDLVQLVVSGFKAFSQVRLTLFSSPTPLGAVAADGDGTVRTSVRLPTVGAGVHLLELEGETEDGTAVTERMALEVPGRPVGSYATYLCCFVPEPERIEPDAPVEEVDITLDGHPLGTLLPDEEGGLLVHVPTVDRLRSPAHFVLEARSRLTGQVIRELIDPIPTVASLWATSPTEQGIAISGSGFAAEGRVHSESGIDVSGSGPVLEGGVEYATRLVVSGGAASSPIPARQVQPGQGHPPTPDLADYRPGGSVARTAANYRSVDPSACVGGTWAPRATENLTGVVYVPCGVTLTGASRTYGATIAAEGSVYIGGNGVVVGPRQAGMPSVISGATGPRAILVEGTLATLRGTAFAVAGGISVAGSGAVLDCGALAQTVVVSGSGASAPVSGRCRL